MSPALTADGRGKHAKPAQQNGIRNAPDARGTATRKSHAVSSTHETTCHASGASDMDWDMCANWTAVCPALLPKRPKCAPAFAATCGLLACLPA